MFVVYLCIIGSKLFVATLCGNVRIECENANMVNTAADCSCHMSNLPSNEAESPLVPKDKCSCHGIVIIL